MASDPTRRRSIYLLLSVFFLGMFGYPWIKQALLMRYGTPIEGRVVGTHLESSQSDDSSPVQWTYYADYEYTPALSGPIGRSHKVSPERYAGIKKGQAVPLRYLPSAPRVAIWEDPSDIEPIAMLAVGAVVALMIGGFAFAHENNATDDD